MKRYCLQWIYYCSRITNEKKFGVPSLNSDVFILGNGYCSPASEMKID